MVREAGGSPGEGTIGTMPRKILGIGELTDRELYSQLTYEPCGHRLDIVRYDDFEGEVRRLHSTCLECKRMAGREKGQEDG